MGEVDVNLVVRAAETLTANVLAKSTRSPRVDLGEELPAVRADFVRLEQLFINLIQNACEAVQSAGEGGIWLESRWDWDAASWRMRVSVRDEGVGMSEEDLQRMRTPFLTTKRDRGGLGLGVPISYSIVELHGGKLEYESRLGARTTATVTLPPAAGYGSEIRA